MYLPGVMGRQIDLSWLDEKTLDPVNFHILDNKP